MKAKNVRFSLVLIIWVLGIIMMSIQPVSAVPKGANITVYTPESAPRVDSGTGAAVSAEAGNITELFINSTHVTTRWQGYYGNISGRITLDDAYNYSLYDWEIANPTGEIYAANQTSTVYWSDIMCFNYSANTTTGQVNINITNVETDLMGAGVNDIDGVNETFNVTYTDATGFSVGGVTINTNDQCKMTYLYVSDAYQQTDYKEVILTDNRSVVWTALIEPDGTTGYDGNKWDFQMMVGEDGDVSTATTYYFYVEIA